MIEEMQANATYTKIVTEDGSPTVRVTSPDFPPEDMHHSGGALSESMYVYAEIVRAALNFNLPPSILSVGLGLGYNEAIAIAETLLFEKKRYDFLEKLIMPKRPEHVATEIRVLSFEKDEQIRHHYSNWIQNKNTDSFWSPLFEEVLVFVAKRYDMSESYLKKEMNRLWKAKRFQVADAIENYAAHSTDRFSIILYDAFSNKADPVLWSEEFLTPFLNTMSDPFCFFSSYAALANLNRSLEVSGYVIDIQPGFKNKRNATRAYRCV